jgi:hypothetical protein
MVNNGVRKKKKKLKFVYFQGTIFLKNSIQINGRNHHTKNERESQRRVRSYLTHSPSNVSQL